MINVYFYRNRNRDHVIEKWEGCTAVPRSGDGVRLGETHAHGTVMEVVWSKSKPGPDAPQIADAYVNLHAARADMSGMTGVQIGNGGVQTNVFGR